MTIRASLIFTIPAWGACLLASCSHDSSPRSQSSSHTSAEAQSEAPSEKPAEQPTEPSAATEPIAQQKTLSNAEKHWQSGLELMRQRQREQAIAAFASAIEADEKFAPAYEARGRCQDQLGQDEKALSDFSEAMQRDPDYAPAYCARADFYRRREKTELGLTDANRAIELDPNLARAYVSRGTVKLIKDIGEASTYRNDVQKALEHFQRATQTALDDLARALELDPLLADAYFETGKILIYQKDVQSDPEAIKSLVDQAVTNFDKAIELDPHHANAHAVRAAARFDQRMDYSKVIPDLLAAIRLDPVEAPGLAFLLTSLWSPNDFEAPETVSQIEGGIVALGKRAIEPLRKSYATVDDLHQKYNYATERMAATGSSDAQIDAAMGTNRRFFVAKRSIKRMLDQVEKNQAESGRSQ